MMNFEEFCNYVEKEVLSVNPDWSGRTALVKDVRKNNGVMLKGLTITESGKNVFPTIYLDEYYEEMVIDNKTKEAVLEDIACVYEHCLKQTPEFDIIGELQESRIIGVLVNREHNEALLKDIPHLLVGDSLAVIFKYLLEMSTNGFSSVTITDYLAELKGYDEHTLMKIALTNTPELMKCSFQNMVNIVKKSIGEGFVEEMDNKDMRMYVLSNQQNQWGAFSIFYPQVRKKLVTLFRKDLIVVPSSIHELLIIPMDKDTDLSYIDNMVKEVNSTAVAVEEQLADKAFVLKRDGSDDISKFISYYAPGK